MGDHVGIPGVVLYSFCSSAPFTFPQSHWPLFFYALLLRCMPHSQLQLAALTLHCGTTCFHHKLQLSAFQHCNPCHSHPIATLTPLVALCPEFPWLLCLQCPSSARKNPCTVTQNTHSALIQFLPTDDCNAVTCELAAGWRTQQLLVGTRNNRVFGNPNIVLPVLAENSLGQLPNGPVISHAKTACEV